MSNQKIREMELPGNQKLSVTEVDFEVVREGWDEYKLSEGTKLRVKNVLMRVFLQVDDDGDIIYNEQGEPNVIVVGSQTIVPISEKR
jgi:hypothetical protein